MDEESKTSAQTEEPLADDSCWEENHSFHGIWPLVGFPGGCPHSIGGLKEFFNFKILKMRSCE